MSREHRVDPGQVQVGVSEILRISYPPDVARFAKLYGHSDQRLLVLGTATAQAKFSSPTDVGLIDLDGAGQPVAPGPHEHRPQARSSITRPGSNVGADPE